MNTINDIIKEQQTKGLLSPSSNEKQENQVSDKKNPEFRLYAIFNVAAPYPDYRWDALWLMNYYKKKEGLLFRRQWQAIQYKIDEIVERCKVIMVYNNRKDAKYTVIFKIKNGVVVINNLEIDNRYETGKKWVLRLDMNSITRE